MSSHDVRKNAQWRQATGSEFSVPVATVEREPGPVREIWFSRDSPTFSTARPVSGAISWQEYQDSAQVRGTEGNILISGGRLAALSTLRVDTNCVTTIYLLSLLFLCHCDLEFDVKEAEKSTLIRDWIRSR